MAQSTNFQSIIMNLQEFWSHQGCLIWQPYYSQVGAGTMNPATFLRVLGPEPWNVAYVEPSVRPDDGRYGENPNRLQQHYQFQVILKPDPGNPQELYLQSLQAIGIDPAQHDIRFVEDNWESPALGAWGLGLGSLDGWAGDHPIHLLPAGRRTIIGACLRRNHLWPGSNRDGIAKGQQFPRHPLERYPDRRGCEPEG